MRLSSGALRLAGLGDAQAQARQCLQNLQRALEAAGGSLRDVVKLTTYSTHPAWRSALAEARPEFFAPPYPASTDIVVSALFKPEALFEVEAIAVVDTDSGRGRSMAGTLVLVWLLSPACRSPRPPGRHRLRAYQAAGPGTPVR